MQSVALHALQDSLSDIATKNVSTISIKLTHLILRKKSSDQKTRIDLRIQIGFGLTVLALPRFSEIATKNVSKIKIKLTHRLVINLPSHSTESTELEGKAMLNCFVCIGVLAQLLMCTLYQKF